MYENEINVLAIFESCKLVDRTVDARTEGVGTVDKESGGRVQSKCSEVWLRRRI